MQIYYCLLKHNSFRARSDGQRYGWNYARTKNLSKGLLLISVPSWENWTSEANLICIAHLTVKVPKGLQTLADTLKT